MTMGEQHFAGHNGGPAQQQPLPAPVVDAVHARGLGTLVSTRFTANPITTALLSFGAAAACFGLMYLVAAIGEDADGVLYAVLRFFALFGCFGMVAALAFGISALVRGAQTFYIFTNGVVHRRNSRATGYTWAELSELRSVIGTKGDNAGKLLHYQLVPTTGRPFAIPMLVVDGRDEFMDNLIAAMNYHGRPVN
ncbi:hypothetical protein GCM10009682_17910 [Luedemannella flava]|uniref:Photosystem I assembly protein Ycf4 n=1 Tax=Luedemannella flava TaxID=349316 RepID=A0ABN2LQC5_9ACTN